MEVVSTADSCCDLTMSHTHATLTARPTWQERPELQKDLDQAKGQDS
jgi:hypothetical protein